MNYILHDYDFGVMVMNGFLLAGLDELRYEMDEIQFELDEIFRQFDIAMDEERIKFNAWANSKGYEGVFLKPFGKYDFSKK